MGRFLSRDPIGVWGDSGNLGNPYAYVGNQPWQYTDPYGLCPTCLAGAVAGLVAGVAIYGVAVATTDADFSWKHLGLAAAIGTAGGALIGTGVGIGAGAGMFSSIGGAVVAGAGEGILTSVTLDTLDDAAVNEGVGAYAASAATGAITNGAFASLGKGVSAWKGTRGNSIDEIWPPNRGFAHEPVDHILLPGVRVNRYGSEAGTFVSPQGVSFSMRALPDASLARPFTTYVVEESIRVRSGLSAPWFGQEGLGIQYELSRPVKDLIQDGFLRRI